MTSIKIANRLKDDRVTLREITREDSEAVVRWRNAEIANKVFFSDLTLTVESQRQWLSAYEKNPSDITLIIERDGNPIGMVSLYSIREKTAEFGRLLIGEKEFRRQGFAAEATRMLLEYGFKDMGLKEIFARVFEDNKSAVNLYLSLGFEIGEREISHEGRTILTLSIRKQGCQCQ
jgi:RimJ/RimL family protein N-acetyltransferase